MGRLTPDYTSAFSRDVKRLNKKHVDLAPLEELITLVCANNQASLDILKRRHEMHTLKGTWHGAHECHIANAGDWLVIWKTANGVAVFQRTGTHDDLFRK